MITKSFAYYCNANGHNADAILARLRDKSNERLDADAWAVLIAWKNQQAMFTRADAAEMVGMSFATIMKRFEMYGK